MKQLKPPVAEYAPYNHAGRTGWFRLALRVYLIMGTLAMAIIIAAEIYGRNRQDILRMLNALTFFQVANIVEGCFWCLVAVVIACMRRSSNNSRFILASAFALFGVSDFIEASSGAWWRPGWLLAWKAICVVVFVVAILRYYRRTRTGAPSTPRASSQP